MGSPRLDTYLAPGAPESLRRFRYVGADHSLLYKHVLSPFADACLTLCPLWLAPNAITTLGVAAQLGACAVLWCHCPTLSARDPPPPGWTALLAAIALLFYQTLDNMDGKQARRTGSASPLGLLFDHGLDSINGAILGPLITTAVVGPSAIGGALMAFFICAIPFHLNTWEQFHTHEFNLPIVNGPSEGLAVLVAAYAGTALVGRAWWAQPVSQPALVALAATARPLFALAHALAGEPLAAAWDAAAAPPSHCDMVLVPVLGAALVTGLWHVATVARHVAVARGEGVAGLAAAAAHLLPFAALLVAAGAWRHVPATRAAMGAHPWGFHLAVGAALADATSKLQLAHVCAQPFRPAWAGIAMLASVPAAAHWRAAATAGGALAGPLLGALPSGAELVEPLLWACTVVCVSQLLHFCAVAPWEVARALGIDVFDIRKQQQQQQRAGSAVTRSAARV